MEATDEAGETQVVETEAADVETAEAQAEVEASEESRSQPSHRAETPDEADAARASDDDKA